MTTFNLSAVISKINEKKAFLSNVVSSVAKQAAVIANTQEKLASLTMAQNIDGQIVDMASMVEDIFTREDKAITASDRVVFAFFNVSLKNTAKVLPLVRIEELLEAKKTRLDRDAELATQYNAELVEQKNLLSTINANRTKAESELSAILESLPDNMADMLHKAALAVCVVYGHTLSPERDDILKRVESSFFKFKRKDGKRVGIRADVEGLKALSNLVCAMRKIETAHSGMSFEQRVALFEGFDTINYGVETDGKRVGGLCLFSSGELPDVTSAPIQAPKGFSHEAAHAVPNEPTFKPLASYFSQIDGSLVVNSVDGIDVINDLLKSANESRGYSMLKSVKEYRKNPQAALIETIDKFDILLQGYLNVALQEFVESGTHGQLDRLFSSPTMVNSGMLTPYGRQIKSYIACVLPYVVLRHKGEGDSRAYFFEAVKSTRFSKLGISDKVGLYAFGVRSKIDGNDARLPVICLRSHYRIAKALRDLKRADDARIKEAHSREWSEYRSKYGEEYTRHTLQSEIDALKAALSAKAKELANHG